MLFSGTVKFLIFIVGTNDTRSFDECLKVLILINMMQAFTIFI